MAAALLSIFGLAFLQSFLTPLDGRKRGSILALLPLFLTIYFWQQWESVSAGNLLRESYSWVPIIGLEASFSIDQLSLIFALLITGVGTLVLVYSSVYMGRHPDVRKFFAYLLVFMGSMLGLVLADNLILLFIFWELTSFFSYLLIGFNHEKEEAREAALQAFVITTFGGLSMLVGVILIGSITGSYELTHILKQKELIQASELYPLILILFAMGSFTKSAQVPFHFWLPGAMQAPTPVSAYLHSATMVNAGVYLMARLFPVLGGTSLWFWILVPIGCITMLYGAYAALFKKDMKLILAHSTISVLGMLFFQLGLGTPMAISGMVLLLFAHALYKSALFLIAGIVDHAEGTRDISKLSALAEKLPLAALASALASFSYAGVPPFLGFWAKESLYASQLNGEEITLFFAASLVTKMLLFASAIMVGIFPFWRGIKKAKLSFHLSGFSYALAPLCLALAGFWLGLFPHHVTKTILAPAVSLLSGEMAVIDAGAYHFGTTFALSLFTFAGGIIIFWLHSREKLKYLDPERLASVSPRRIYELGFAHFKNFAHKLTNLIQHGYLRFYLFTIFIAVLVILAPLYFEMEGIVNFNFSGVSSWEWAITLLMIAASLTTIFVKLFLFAILALSIVGFGMIMIFALNGGPDLALTLILVEALTLVLLILLIIRLPRYAMVSSKWMKMRDALLAASFGALITGILIKGRNIHLFDNISNFYVENALTLGKGENIVNVILVDFRALDTLGEITVLTIAGISVYSLIKLKGRS